MYTRADVRVIEGAKKKELLSACSHVLRALEEPLSAAAMDEPRPSLSTTAMEEPRPSLSQYNTSSRVLCHIWQGSMTVNVQQVVQHYDDEVVTLSGEARIKIKGLDQLVRFLVVELIHPDLNSRFDIGVVFITNYFFSERRCPRRQRDVLGDRLCESQDQTDSVF
jgi:hypothetical protein